MEISKPLEATWWLILERIAYIVLSLAVTLLVARHLQPEMFGKLSYLLAVASLASPLSALGLNSLVTRELLKRPQDSQLIMGSAIALRFIASSFIAPLAIILGYLYLESAESGLFAFLMIANIFTSGLVIDFWLQAHMANRYASIVRLAGLILISIARILAVTSDLGLPAFVYLAGMEVVCIGFLYGLVYDRLGEGVSKLRVSWSESRRLIKDSRWLLLSGVAAMIYLKIDQLMLGVLVNDRAVGIYAAAARISEVWYFVPAAIVTSFFPQLMRHRLNDVEAYNLNLQKLNDILFCTALLVALSVTYWADWLLPLLFGAAYESAVPVLIIHVWVGLFVFMRALLSKWFIAENLLKLSMLSQVLGAVVNVALNIWLIPLYGPVGAAYATVVSYAGAGYIVLFLHRDLWPMGLVVSRSILLPYRLLRKGRNLYQP